MGNRGGVMKKLVCRILWDISEFTGIGLGRFAPYVFEGMLGLESNKKKKILEGE